MNDQETSCAAWRARGVETREMTRVQVVARSMTEGTRVIEGGGGGAGGCVGFMTTRKEWDWRREARANPMGEVEMMPIVGGGLLGGMVVVNGGGGGELEGSRIAPGSLFRGS